MGSRMQRLGAEIARFGAVNGVATVVALGLFNLLVHGAWVIRGPMHGQAIWAYLIANLIGMLISFVGSRKYAFKHREPRGPAGGLVNYALINTASFLIPMSCLWVTRDLMHQPGFWVDNISANGVGAVLAMAARYWAFKRFVFKRKRPWVARLRRSEQ